MTYRTPTRRLSAAAAALTLALALTACSSSGDPQSTGSTGETGASTATTEAAGVVFQFEDFSAGPAQEITVTVPDDLLEAAGLAASDLLAPTVTIRAHELETAQACAVDLVHTYSDGIVGLPLTADQAAGAYDVDAANEADVLAFRLGRDTYSKTGDFSEGTAVEKNGARSIDDLDPADPEDGAYFSADLKTVTLVTECAAAPSDVDRVDNRNNRITFNTYDEARASRGGATELAFVAFNVMKDGTVTLVSPEVDGFIRDANGTWIAD